MRGLVSTPMENLDQFMSGEVTNHLFEQKNVPFSGLDLAAINIQRGRDHGLRPYNEYREACNLRRAETFEDLSPEVSDDVIRRLKQVKAKLSWNMGLVKQQSAVKFRIPASGERIILFLVKMLFRECMKP